METQLIAVIVWIAIAAAGFLAGLAGIAATRRRMDAQGPVGQPRSDATGAPNDARVTTSR